MAFGATNSPRRCTASSANFFSSWIPDNQEEALRLLGEHATTTVGDTTEVT
jgi:hypothetical protein